MGYFLILSTYILLFSVHNSAAMAFAGKFSGICCSFSRNALALKSYFSIYCGKLHTLLQAAVTCTVSALERYIVHVLCAFTLLSNI